MAKNKLAKFAEMETLDNVFQPKHDEVFRTDYKLKGKWGEQVFGNGHPIVLEVGCGKGEYSVGLGELYQEKGMKNVAFLRTHAEMLESVFAPGEISEIWITFPDPQMAKARKRLTGTRFLSLYKKMLTEDGVIHLKTDSPFLYRYTDALIRQNHLTAFVNTDDLYGMGLDDKILGIKTFYEQQWLSRGKKIKYLKFTLSGSGELTEPDIDIEKDDYHSEARFMSK